jgi:DNA-binding NtrC family response regulator
MLMQTPAAHPQTEATPRKDLKTLIEDYEKTLIMGALQRTNGNQRQAAFALGILPTTLHEKLKRLGLFPLRRIESLWRIDGGQVGIDSPQI